MARVTKYLHYEIVLTDKAAVDQAQGLYPDGIFMAPDDAATLYSAPIQTTTTPFVAPGIRSPWIIVIPDANYPTNVATIIRKSGGWFGIHLLFGNTYTYKWIGRFEYAASLVGEVGGVPVVNVAIAQRKWAIGFEAPTDGEMLGIGNGANISRDSSRHVDGFGFWYRDNGDEVTATCVNNGAAASPDTWERFYFRVRALPTLGAARIWSAGATNGACLRIDATGRLTCWSMTGGVEALQGTAAGVIPINTWKRVDIILHSAAAAGGYLKIFVNRAPVMAVNFAAGVGMSAHGANHSASHLGDATGVALETFECDFDDWIGAAHPTELSAGVYTGLDWLNGSKVAFVDAGAAGAGNAWTGDYRLLNSRDPVSNAAGQGVTTTTSAASLVMDMRSSQIDTHLGALGAVCFTAMWYQRQATSIAGTAATFGWRFAGLLDLFAIALVINVESWVRRMYRPAGLLAPVDITPLELHYVKYGNVSAAFCYAVCASVELIGTFGAEDVPADEVVAPDSFPARVGNHVAPYQETPWARQATPAVSPVVVHSGQYVGNDTVQELQFRSPVTWFVVMQTAANGGGVFFFSSAAVSHQIGRRNGNPAIAGLIDPSFAASGVEDQQQQRTVVRLIGSGADFNALGTTYNYIAFQDPGARFSQNGAFTHTAALAAGVNLMPNDLFLPTCFFAQMERLASVDASFAHYMKGSGHTGTNGSPLNGAEVATLGGALTAGQILSGVTLHSDADDCAYAAFRMDDHSSDPNKHKVIKTGTYVGDGAASRSIGFPGTPSGLRPLYAIVVPHNAASFHRCPLNTGTTSNNMGTGASIAATGITAGGIDSMVVGSLGNTNAVVYDWFVILGSATAGNNGWSIDGEFAYVEPDWPADSDEPAGLDPIEDEIEDPDPDPGPGDDDDCLAGEVCVAATTREVNRALLEIGNTKFLTNYCTQNTLEAQTARLLYESSVRAVLHAFPWPFATKYATLALAATQPTHEDWDFAYRQPVDCIFERRLVVDRGPGVDPKGPGFELSSDASGGLILTNEANAVLEYTCRPPCVAFVADALFKEAFVWHLASKMAPPLTRMADKAKFCLDEYDKSILKANAIVKPGQPGLRDVPDPAGNDAAAACITANVMVANLALVRIGANTIANLATEQSREAVACNLIFEHELRATLRDYPWKFAKRYNSALVLVGGTVTVPVNTDWQYSYRLPADYVSVRRLPTTGTGRSFERYPKTFEVGTDVTGNLLFTGEDVPNLEYTARVPCAVARADDLFRDALAWRLAASLAISLAQTDPEKEEARGRGPDSPPDATQRISLKPNLAQMRANTQRWAFGQYLRAIEKARVADANESEPEPHGDAEWIEGRN